MANSESSNKPGRGARIHDDGVSDSASQRFKRLRLRTQRMLAREIVTTRRDELRRAYPDIIDIAFGNRSRRHDPDGVSRVVKETCVILVVERKSRNVGDAQRLPTVLTTYHTIGRRRQLVAVPVDVEERSALAGATPGAAPAHLAVLSGNASASRGQACAAVRFPLVPDAIMVISCKHVFTLKAMLDQPFAASLVYLADDPGEVTEIAITIDRAGALRQGTPEADFSFDAQLALVEDGDAARARLHAVLGDVTLQGVVESFDEVPDELWVQTSRGPIKVDFDEQAPEGSARPKIEYPTIGDVYHEALIISQFQEHSPLRDGDSGSAVTTKKNGGLLVGMHIGSNPTTRRAYAIPGWQVVDPKMYPGSIPIETWELADPMTLPPPPTISSVVAAAPDGLVLPGAGATNDEFAEFAITACTELAKQYPINATVAAGQCILESGWGRSGGAREHGIYFGIKASGNFSGSAASHRTVENVGGHEVEVEESFRAYDNWWSSFLDYGELIGKAKRYETTRQAKANPRKYLEEIKAAGYATDPQYVDKVRAIVNNKPGILGGPI